MGFRYQEGGLTTLESPSEDCRSLQQKVLKADGGGTFEYPGILIAPGVQLQHFCRRWREMGRSQFSLCPPKVSC